MKAYMKEVWGGVNAGVTKILLGISVLFLICIAVLASLQKTEAATPPTTLSDTPPAIVDVQEPAPVVDAVAMSDAVDSAVAAATTEVTTDESDEPIIYVMVDNAKQLWVSVVERYEDYMARAETASAPPVTNTTGPTAGDIPVEAPTTQVK